MKRPVAWFGAFLLSIGFLFGLVAPAQAAPPTAPWTAAAGGDVLAADVDLAAGIDLVGARLAVSQSDTSSSTTPRVTSRSSNLGVDLAGIGVADRNTQTAPPDNAGAVTGSLADVSVPILAVTGLSTSNEAHWAGNAACVTSGVLADSRVETLSTRVTAVVDVVSTGVSSTTGVTRLVSTGAGYNYGVQSSATGRVANVNVLGTAVQIGIAGDSTLTARADGTNGSGSFTYNPGTVTVTVAGVPTVVAVGSTLPVDLGPVGRVDVTVNNLTTTPAANGQSASANVSVVTLNVRVGPSALPTATATVNLLPLRASVTVPNGGIDCPPPAPVIQTPANNSSTSDTTPTYSGTGVAGAAINLTVDGTTSNAVATVAAGGTWTYTPTTALGQGNHTVSATQTLNGATSTASNTNTFTVDTDPPATPTLATPANGSLTNDSTPTFTGTAEANSEVRVFVDANPIGTTTATAGGNFSFTPTSAIAEGPHLAFVRAADAAGNVSGDSNTNSFTIDSIAPADPVVLSPANNSSTNDDTPTITGTGPANTSIRVFLDGSLAGTTTSNGAGNWSNTSGPLLDGSHTVYAVARDAANNDSGPSNTNTFTVDTVVAAPIILTPLPATVVPGPNVTVTGTGESGAAVVVTDQNGATYGPVTVTGGGTWSVVMPGLVDGSYTITAAQTDAAGNPSGASLPRSFQVSAPPVAPVISTPADGSTTNDSTPTISGTGQPLATVNLAIDSGVPIPIPVTAGGAWSYTPLVPLGDGPHTLSATQTDIGGTSPAATSSFTIDATPPAAPIVLLPANGSTTGDTTPTISGTTALGTTVAVSIDGAPAGVATVTGVAWTFTPTTALAEGSHTVSAVATDGAGNPSGPSNTNIFTVDIAPGAPSITTPADGSTVNDTTPTIAGTGQPGALVSLTIDGVPVAAIVTVDGSGNWTYTPTVPLPEGSHTVVARQSDAGGISPAATSTFTIDAAPNAPTITAPADGTVTTDATPTVTGTGQAGATIVLTLNAVPVVDVITVAGNGTWTYTPLLPLPDATYTAVATQTDGGGVSAPSAPVSFTIDATAPLPPVVLLPADGSTVLTATPTITGTTELGTTVQVFVDGSSLGSATVTAAAWTFAVPTALSEGQHTVYAVARDAAGNTTRSVLTNTFTVDVAPTAPSITAPADGSTTTDSTPTISGQGQPNALITLTLDGVPVVGPITVAGNGSWTYTPTVPLPNGTYDLVARQTDGGGISGPSPTVTFTVDAPPLAPIVLLPADGTTTNDATPLITGTTTPGTTVDVYVDGVNRGQADVTLAAWTFTVPTALSQGPHEVYAIATLGASASQPSNTNTFIVDVPPAAPVITAPTNGTITTDNTPTISGTGQPGATVVLTLNLAPVVDVITVDGDGNWTYTPLLPLPDATYTAVATQVDGGGISLPSAPVSFTIDATAPLPPVVLLPADGTTVNTTTPTVSGTTELGTSVRVFIDDTDRGTALVSGVTWNFVVPTALTEGSHEVYAVACDTAGNETRSLLTNTFVVDVAPPAPVISTPANGSSTNDTTPEIAGTGQPNATLNLTVDGVPVTPITVAGNGSWSFTSGTPLGQGPHTVVATQTDAGGTSASATTTFTIDTAVPSPPIITDPDDGDTVGELPQISGQAEAGATVTVIVDGQPVGEAEADAEGNWSFTPTSPLTPGQHVITATQTDAAENTSGPSEPVTVTVAEIASPVIDTPSEGAVLTDTTPTVSGTAEPNSAITLRHAADSLPAGARASAGQLIGTTTAAADGSWSVTFATELEPGSYAVVATQTVPAYENRTSNVRRFSIPADDGITPPVITRPGAGDDVDSPVQVCGTGEPGASIQIVDQTGAAIGSTTVLSDGTFCVEVSLASGSYTIRAVQTVGDATQTSPSVEFTVESGGGGGGGGLRRRLRWLERRQRVPPRHRWSGPRCADRWTRPAPRRRRRLRRGPPPQLTPVPVPAPLRRSSPTPARPSPHPPPREKYAGYAWRRCRGRPAYFREQGGRGRGTTGRSTSSGGLAAETSPSRTA